MCNLLEVWCDVIYVMVPATSVIRYAKGCTWPCMCKVYWGMEQWLSNQEARRPALAMYMSAKRSGVRHRQLTVTYSISLCMCIQKNTVASFLLFTWFIYFSCQHSHHKYKYIRTMHATKVSALRTVSGQCKNARISRYSLWHSWLISANR